MPTASLRFCVLGSVEIWDARGETASIDSPKQRLLLAALLSRADQVVSADRLIDALWGDATPADPIAALQTHISRLRKLLESVAPGVEHLHTEPYGYKLALAGAELDAQEFDDRSSAARAADEPETTLTLIDGALGLWHGEPYAEFAELPFFRSESTRLTELFMVTREHRGELLLTLGRHIEAVPFLEALVAEDPLRERPRALLMQALYHSSRQGESLGILQQYRRLLSEELGIEPSPALRELEQQILQHELNSGTACPPLSVPGLPIGAAFAERPIADLEISYFEPVEGQSLAIGTVGSGPPLVVVPAFVTNLTTLAEGRDPRSGLLAGLADHFRLVLYDRLGTGLSEGCGKDYSVQASAAELLAVLDHLELDRVAILASSCAGPAGLLLAATEPSRVSHLFLLGTMANGPATFYREDLRDSMLALVRAHWGIASKVMVDMMFPGGDPEIGERFARMQREAATPEIAALCLAALYEGDVSDHLSRIQAPSLVIHYTEDRAFPFLAGRQLAAKLPDARFLPLSGRWHLPSESDLPRVVRLITEFAQT